MGVNSMFVLVVFYLTLSLVSTHDCDTIHALNSPKRLKNYLNCSRVIGNLKLTIMDNVSVNDWKNYTFLDLTEITGYLLVYRVTGLTTLEKLFPKLAVIRGHSLISNFALIIYETNSMIRIGLPALRLIQRGYVSITSNPSLCYVNTIDWDRILPPGGQNMSILKNNNEPKNCPTIHACRECEPKFCWDALHCQKVLDKEECDPTCLGGCLGPTPSQCRVCKKYAFDGTCFNECPKNTVAFNEEYRCVTPLYCRHLGRQWFPFRGVCVSECPPGYRPVFLRGLRPRGNNVTRELPDNNTERDDDEDDCVKCDGPCPKICPGIEISTIAEAQKMRGCNIINGSLQIRLGNINIVEELEENMADIYEIRGFLKIYRSFFLITLTFLKSLAKINGEELVNSLYAFYVYENTNLQKLFDWNTTNLTISNGSIQFYNNPYLCLSEIQKLTKLTNIKTFPSSGLIPDSNGYKAACNAVKLTSKYEVLSKDEVIIYWEHYEELEEQNLLGYLIHYIEAPFQNITTYYGRDSCFKHTWQSMVVELPERNRSKRENWMTDKLMNLTAYTQYAFFVKTYSLEKIGKRIEGQTELMYFRTHPDQPGVPLVVKTASVSPNSITVSWLPPYQPNGVLTHYIVYVFHQPDSVQALDRRNYCLEPMQHMQENEKYAPNFQGDKDWSTTVKSPTDDDECVCPDHDENFVRMLEQLCDTSSTGNRKLPSLTPSERMQHCSVFNYFEEEQASHVRFKRDYQKEHLLINDKSKVLETKVNATFQTYTIPNLRPFNLYSIQVAACNMDINNREQCSSVIFHNQRCGRNDSADDILDFFIKSDNRSAIELFWSEPKIPNAVVLTYEIEHRRLDIQNTKPTIECITRKAHEISGNRYEMFYLHPGHYGIRVRATSLAGDGRFTNLLKFVVVNETEQASWKIIVPTILTILLISGIGGGVFYWKKRRSTNIDDDIRLLASNYDAFNFEMDDEDSEQDRVRLVRDDVEGDFRILYRGGNLEPENEHRNDEGEGESLQDI